MRPDFIMEIVMTACLRSWESLSHLSHRWCLLFRGNQQSNTGLSIMETYNYDCPIQYCTVWLVSINVNLNLEITVQPQGCEQIPRNPIGFVFGRDSGLSLSKCLDSPIGISVHNLPPQRSFHPGLPSSKVSNKVQSFLNIGAIQFVGKWEPTDS